MAKGNEAGNQTEGKDSMTIGERFWEIVEKYWKPLMGLSIVLLISGVVRYICESMDISHKDFENLKEMMQSHWMLVADSLCMAVGLLGLPVSLMGSTRVKTRECIATKKKEFSERYQNLRQQGYPDISIKINKLKEMKFEQESKNIDYRNKAIQKFREEMHDSEIGQRQWRRIILWLEEASDLCDVSEVNLEVVVTPMLISLIAVGVAVLLGILDRIGNSQIAIVLISLVGTLLVLVLVFISITSLGYERRKTQEFNEYLRWRKMLLQAAKREVEARLSELAEEEKQKELEEAKKRCEQKVCEDKVLKSTTKIKFFGKEILRMDSEKDLKNRLDE